jgi:alpha-amylase
MKRAVGVLVAAAMLLNVCAPLALGAEPTGVRSVSLSQGKSMVLEKGKSVALTALVEPGSVVNRKVSFKSSKPSVARVTKSGRVSGLKYGTARITVTTVSGRKKATITVRVVKPVKTKKLGLSPASVSMNAGASWQLRPVFTPKGVTNKGLRWTSSDPPGLGRSRRWVRATAS